MSFSLLNINPVSPSMRRLAFLFAIVCCAALSLTLTGCGGGGGGGGSNSGLTGGGGGTSGTSNFDIATATLVITGPSTVAPNGVINLVATLKDASGNAPDSPGLFISLTPNPQRGTIAVGGVPNTGGGNTNANGEVPFTYQADNQENTITITASASSGGTTKTDTHVITVDDGFNFTTATITITGPDSVPVNSSSPYTARIVDGMGRAPVTPLNMNIQPTQGTTSPNSGNTNANGEVTFNFNAPNNNASVTITVTAQENGATKTGTKNVQVLPNNFQFTSPADNSTVISGTPQALTINWTVGGAPVTTGQALPGGGTASQITLSVSGGGSGGGFRVNGGAPTNPVSVNASNGGFGPTVQIEANTAGGAATVTATANGGFSDTLPLNFRGSPSSLDLAVNPNNIPAGGSSTMTATVRDASGNALQGITVNFAIDTCAGGGAPPCPPNERVNPLSANTNASGQATSFYTHQSGNPTGSAFVRATASGGSNPSNLQLITVNP